MRGGGQRQMAESAMVVRDMCWGAKPQMENSCCGARPQPQRRPACIAISRRLSASLSHGPFLSSIAIPFPLYRLGLLAIQTGARLLLPPDPCTPLPNPPPPSIYLLLTASLDPRRINNHSSAEAGRVSRSANISRKNPEDVTAIDFHSTFPISAWCILRSGGSQ